MPALLKSPQVVNLQRAGMVKESSELTALRQVSAQLTALASITSELGRGQDDAMRKHAEAITAQTKLLASILVSLTEQKSQPPLSNGQWRMAVTQRDKDGRIVAATMTKEE